MREAADFYDLERPGLGTEFLDEVERTLRQVMARRGAVPGVR